MDDMIYFEYDAIMFKLQFKLQQANTLKLINDKHIKVRCLYDKYINGDM